MTTHKTISTLAIAGIILLAAAGTSLAQTTADNSAKRAVAAPESGLELALNRAPISATNFRSTEAKPAAEESAAVKPKLSSSMFLSSGFSYVNEKTSFSPQFTIYDNTKIDSKPQFTTDEGIPTSTSTNHRVTFVPSMGQKIPS
jgi:hypothetical protein